MFKSLKQAIYGFLVAISLSSTPACSLPQIPTLNLAPIQQVDLPRLSEQMSSINTRLENLQNPVQEFSYDFDVVKLFEDFPRLQDFDQQPLSQALSQEKLGDFIVLAQHSVLCENQGLYLKIDPPTYLEDQAIYNQKIPVFALQFQQEQGGQYHIVKAYDQGSISALQTLSKQHWFQDAQIELFTENERLIHAWPMKAIAMTSYKQSGNFESLQFDLI